MKRRPGTGVTRRQSSCSGSADGEQQQDLGLQRIGVLELVDEDVREARLEAAAHAGVAAHQVARLEQQIEEVERAGARLQRLRTSRSAPAQLALQRRREVRVGVRAGTDRAAA